MALNELDIGQRNTNIGLWDQIAALEWIQRNIYSFNGDRRQVTIFGPNSASALPLALLTNQKYLTPERELRKQQKLSTTNKEIDYLDNNHYRETDHQELEINQNDISPNLFNKVWLIDPTVFYKFELKQAYQHYSRLFKDMLTRCSSSSSINNHMLANDDLSVASESAIPIERSNNDNLLSTTIQQTKITNNNNATAECLRNKVNFEDIIKQYLGSDDATYRLDDENCLPIHGVFANQLIVVDNELVNSWYPFERNSNVKKESSKISSLTKKFLIGSSAQAIGFWPCPLKATNWTWQEFKRYVSTSFNSFNTNVYSTIDTKYNTIENNTSVISATEKYLTMVSDIRQVCPSNKLSDNLKKAHQHSVQRYIVETRPSKSINLQKSDAYHHVSCPSGNNLSENYSANSTTNKSNIYQLQNCNSDSIEQESMQRQFKQNFAFHGWDLIAFFGFQNTDKFTANDKDISFQTQIRRMVKQFVHSNQEQSYDDDSVKVFSNTQDESLNLVTSTIDKPYKWRECQTINELLGDSYAWIS